jgi:hypothetical protein
MLLTLILCVGFVLTTPMAHADAWGANMAAMLMKQVMEKIARQIEGALLGSLKMTAMNMLNSQIGQLIGGGGGAAPRFITNWEDALIADPTRKTQLYMNDFFTLSTRGMGSSANYIRAGAPLLAAGSSGVGTFGACTGKRDKDLCSDGGVNGTCRIVSQFISGGDNGLRCLKGLDLNAPCPSGVRDSFGGCGVENTSAYLKGSHLNNPLAMNDPFTLRAEGVSISGGSVTGGNYAQYLERVGRAAISGGGQKTMTLNEYTPSPEVMFQQGDWRAFDSFISNPMNNPYGYSIAAEQAYQTKLEQEKEIARTEAIAYQGFKGTETSGGNITTPGSTIKSIVDNANDFGNKIISGASNPAEILSSLAATAANKAINGLVQKGIGEVQSQINKQIGAINNQARAIVNEATTALGPGAQFLPEIQRGISLNSDFTRGLSSSGSSTSGRSGVGSVGACSGKTEGNACNNAENEYGTCEFLFEASGSDNGLRCLIPTSGSNNTSSSSPDQSDGVKRCKTDSDCAKYENMECSNIGLCATKY